jgi:hypothetical protein
MIDVMKKVIEDFVDDSFIDLVKSFVERVPKLRICLFIINSSRMQRHLLFVDPSMLDDETQRKYISTVANEAEADATVAILPMEMLIRDRQSETSKTSKSVIILVETLLNRKMTLLPYDKVDGKVVWGTALPVKLRPGKQPGTMCSFAEYLPPPSGEALA